MPRRKRILVADEDMLSRDAVSFHLKSLGYRVVAAPDAVRAANVVAQEDVELVILDAEMVRGRPLPRPIKVIALTRDDSGADELVERDLVDGCVSKPVDLTALEEIVRRLAEPPAQRESGLYRRVLRSGVVPGPVFRRTLALLRSTRSPRMGTPSPNNSSR